MPYTCTGTAFGAVPVSKPDTGYFKDNMITLQADPGNFCSLVSELIHRISNLIHKMHALIHVSCYSIHR